MTVPDRRRRNAAARAELAVGRAKAMPARQRLANLAASTAAQPQLEHLARLTAKATTATATKENPLSATTEWTTVDFRPAAAGWRLAYDTGKDISVVAMPGWLIQEGHRGNNNDRVPVGRRVVAAEVDLTDECASLIEAVDVWKILAPGEDVAPLRSQAGYLTDDEIIALLGPDYAPLPDLPPGVHPGSPQAKAQRTRDIARRRAERLALAQAAANEQRAS